MTSQLNVDTIVDKAGSGGTNVKIGNTSTYVSEGGAVTQNTVQGLIKVWFYKEQDGASLGDSFNVSSLTDTGTGDFTVVFANDFSNSKFGSGSNDVGAHEGQASSGGVQSVDFQTTFSRFKTYQNGSLTDFIVNGNFAGDLA